MNKVQLSYNQVREYILYLERIELISCDRGRRVYRTTMKKGYGSWNYITKLMNLHLYIELEISDHYHS